MTRHVVPEIVPPTPDGYTGWARSTKRAGGVYHLHALGLTACRRLVLDRYDCHNAEGLGDFQYWGACPACHRIATKETDQ